MADKTGNCEISLKSLKKTISSFVYTLTLPNLFALPKYVHVKVSPTFEFANATWFFRFYPNGRPVDFNKKYFDVSIVRKTSEEPFHKIFYTITLLDASGRKYDDFYNVDVFDKDNLEHGMAHFTQESRKRRHPEITSQYDTLQLICELFCDKLVEKPIILNRESLTPNKDAEALSKDFTELFKNGKKQDLILRVADKEFPVHQDILIARCEVFKSMLTDDMTEENKGVVDVRDCDPEAVEQFLFYIYSGKVQSLNQHNMFGLYYVAEKYNMILLKEKCSEFIKKSLLPSIVCDVVQLALNHGDSDLLECATEYFVNNIGKILLTEEWMSFMKTNTVAANELLIKLTKK